MTTVDENSPIRKIWKPELYRIQMEAPKARIIPCGSLDVLHHPNFYGDEYHGVLGHKDAAALLEGQPNGSYLVRKGAAENDFYTLTWRFDNKIHHYKLYYDGKHFVREKRYKSIHELVADGLVTMHMELKASHIIDMMHAKSVYQESPYITLHRRKLRALSAKKNREICENAMPRTANNNICNEVKDNLANKMQSNFQTTDNTTWDASNRSSFIDNPLVGKYNKAHSFKVHTFKGLNWCELCANFLWGFTAQGMKCEDCGFIAHSKCSERVPSLCLPDLKRLRGVFGIDLTTLLNAHSSTLPFVVKKCVVEIEARGVEQEGIYRVSGFADEIEALKTAFDKDGEAADLSVYTNINVIAGVLKLYLRLLPVPLITYEAHPHFIKASYAKTSPEQVDILRESLNFLPPAHFITLQYMIQHLYRVSLLFQMNKMTAHNISTVFAPTLVATPPGSTDITSEIITLSVLIEHCPKIYGI